MIKTIIKEACIMLLLCACAILVFGIAFYEYIPLSKITPNKVSYQVPNSIEEELNLDISAQEIQNQHINFSVDGRMLDQYEDSGRLVEGKQNPFSPYTQTQGNATITNGTQTSGGGTGKNPNSTGTYYPNTGMK